MTDESELLRVVDPDLGRLTKDISPAIMLAAIYELRLSPKMAQRISSHLIRTELELLALRAENERLRVQLGLTPTLGALERKPE
jgi:hypothetical protein